MSRSGKEVMVSHLFVLAVLGIFYRYDESQQLYGKLLEEHPSCAPLWKRQVAILKSQGKVMEAIKELNQFLQV